MNSNSVLTAIVPVSRMSKKLGNLRQWLSESNSYLLDVVIVHDKKDEHTGIELCKIIEEISNPRIKLIEGKFNGPGGARNQGLKIANTPWVAFWDSDDIPVLSEIFVLIDSNADSNADVLVGAFNRIRDGESIPFLVGDKRSYLSRLGYRPGIWRFVFRNYILEEIQFPILAMGEDQVFLVQTEFWKRKVEITNHVVYHYFEKNPGSQTASKIAHYDLIKAIEMLVNLVKREPKTMNSNFVAMVLLRNWLSLIKRQPIKATFYSLHSAFIILQSVTKYRSQFRRTFHEFKEIRKKDVQQ